VGLEKEVDRLTAMLGKMEHSTVQIAVFGMVGRGKSSVLNALLGQNVFEVGPLHGVTQTVESANWFVVPTEENSLGDRGVQRIALTGINNSQIQLIDTPGIDEVEGEVREELARQIAKDADLILFVIAGDITQVEYDALSLLRQFGKPMILVFNKIDQYPQADRLAIYHKIKDERVKELLSEGEIVMVAASPLEVKAVRGADGTTKIQRYRSSPQIAELKLKILDILQREGKSLIALNTMLCADEVNSQLVRRKMLIREEGANRLIEKGVMTKAVAIALNPVTALDLFSGAVIDLALILALSRL
jgi:small GTP-binding protein